MNNQKDPGLGVNFQGKVKRLINSDGTYNITRKGGATGVKDGYKTLVGLSWSKFLLVAFCYYLSVNVLFALIYLMVGMDELQGVNDGLGNFWNAFFLSIHTFSSIGFGTIAPSGLGANIVSTIEAFIGFISIAMITGLLYGRFSRPKSKIRFSKNIISTQHENKTAIMFKVVNRRNEILLNSSIKVMFTIDQLNGELAFQKSYHRLKLEVESILFFPLTWTIVHLVDESSPLKGLTLEDLKERNAEFIVMIDCFDQTHQQVVMETYSYGPDDWVDNVKFKRNFSATPDGNILLEIDDLDELIPLN